MNRLITLSLILLITSCSNGLVISPKGCRTSGHWSTQTKQKDFDVSESYWSFFGTKRVYINELLKENKLSCKRIGSINIESVVSWKDSFFYIIPFISRNTIKVSGQFSSNIMEDLKSKD